jgi:hypothetical protein
MGVRELYTILALLHVLEVIGDYPSLVSAKSHRAAISAEGYVRKVLPFGEGDLLVGRGIGGTILIDVDLLHLFALHNIVKVNTAIGATRTKQEVVDLGKCDAGAFG